MRRIQRTTNTPATQRQKHISLFWGVIFLLMWQITCETCKGGSDNTSCIIDGCVLLVEVQSASNGTDIVCLECANASRPSNDGSQCVLQCGWGTYVNEENICKLCNVEGCEECQQQGTCKKCVSGYYLKNGFCRDCDIWGCNTCTDDRICLQCGSGKYLSDDRNQCISLPRTIYSTVQYDDQLYQCPSGCLECEANYSCISCLPSYRLLDGQCFKCSDSNCMECAEFVWSDEDECIQCAYGYGIITLKNTKNQSQVTYQRQCVQCEQQKCLVCLQQSPQTCIQCSEGYYVQDGQCIQCGINFCQTCKVSNETVQCVFCESGSVLSSQSGECIQCVVGCAKCSEQNIGKCLKCRKGYSLMYDTQTCIKCPANCKLCDSDNACRQCQQGYQLNEVSMCSPKPNCSPYCLQCESNNKCKMYLGGYPAQKYSRNIDQAEQMYPIPRGYYFSTYNQSNMTYMEEKCLFTQPKCIDCILSDSNLVCSMCQFGYYLTSNHQCLQCPISCKQCLDENICVDCQIGYYMENFMNQKVGRCHSCNSNQFHCKTCQNSQKQCTSCINGYLLIGRTCVSQTHLEIGLHLSMPLEEFSSNQDQIRKAILDIAQLTDQRDLIMVSVKEGSTIVQYVLSLGNNQQATSSMLELQRGLVSNGQKFPYEMESLPTILIVSEDDSDDKDDEKEDKEQSRNYTGVIIYMIIMGILIFMIAFVFIRSKIKAKRQQNEEGEKKSEGKKSSRRRRSRKNFKQKQQKQQLGKVQSGSDLYSESFHSY